MPYALNVKKGTSIRHPDIGELPGGIAVPITKEQANQLKGIVDIIIFDYVQEVVKENPKINIKEKNG